MGDLGSERQTESNPFYVAHGPPFIVQGVTDRCQRRRMGKNVKGVVVVTVELQCVNTGGQEHLMPVAVDPKSACHCVSVCHGDGFAAMECHRVPQAAQPSATRPWNAPSATRGPMGWSAGTQHSSPRQVPCRGLDLAGPGNLPGSEACRSPGPAGAHIAPRRVSCDVIF